MTHLKSYHVFFKAEEGTEGIKPEIKKGQTDSIWVKATNKKQAYQNAKDKALMALGIEISGLKIGDSF